MQYIFPVRLPEFNIPISYERFSYPRSRKTDKEPKDWFFFKAHTVGCNRRIRIRFWDAGTEAAQYTSAVLITSPKRDKAFILTKKDRKLGLKKKKVRGGTKWWVRQIKKRVGGEEEEISRVKKTDGHLGGS